MSGGWNSTFFPLTPPFLIKSKNSNKPEPSIRKNISKLLMEWASSKKNKPVSPKIRWWRPWWSLIKCKQYSLPLFRTPISFWNSRSVKMWKEPTRRWSSSKTKASWSSWVSCCLFGVNEIPKCPTYKGWMKSLLRSSTYTLRKLTIQMPSLTGGKTQKKSKIWFM